MTAEISLKEAERKVFKATFQDGMWDIFIGCIVLQFAIAPLLSSKLGDFWSSVIFLPFSERVTYVSKQPDKLEKPEITGKVTHDPNFMLRRFKHLGISTG